MSGLSLAIAHRAVTAMCGGIGVASVPGQGGTVWFTVPRALAKRDGWASDGAARYRAVIVDSGASGES